MSREITGNTVEGSFPPLIGIREKGQFVKGRVLALGQTANNNPTVTLELMDLDGSTSISPSKGVYQEIEVNVGAAVQIIGSSKQLRDKLPQLKVGDVVTVTSLGKKKLQGGKTLNEYRVIVD